MSALTKILIVLQLVFSVAVSVLLVLMVSRQEAYSKSAEDYRTKYIASAAQVTQLNAQHASDLALVADAKKGEGDANTQLAKARGEAAAKAGSSQAQILTLEGDVAAQKTQIASLSAALDTANKSIKAKDDELGSLRPQVSKLTVDNNDLARKNNEQENQIRADKQAIQKLQEQLVVKGPAGATNNGGSQVQPMVTASAAMPTSAAVNAKISNVMATAGRTLIEMPLGTRDGIQPNTPVFVYRSTGYVADAVVERVTADNAVAVITRTKDGQQVQAGDIVSTIGK